MATFTASAAQPGVQPRALSVGLIGQAVMIDQTTVSLSIGTVLNMCKVAKNSRVLFMSYGFTGIGDATWQIGDTINGTRYKSAGTLSAGLGMVMANTFSEYVYSADDTIIVRASLSSATTLGGEFHLRAIFQMNDGGAS